MIKKFEEYLESIVEMIKFTRTDKILDKPEEEKLISFYQGMAFGGYRVAVESHPELIAELDRISAEWDEKILEAVKG